MGLSRRTGGVMSADLRAAAEDAIVAIGTLLDHLPDAAVQAAPCWRWAWDELDGTSQEAVKVVRKQARVTLDALRAALASEPFTKHVLVSNELVEELTAHPSEPVTVQICEIAPNGRLEMVFTRVAATPSDEAVARVLDVTPLGLLIPTAVKLDVLECVRAVRAAEARVKGAKE